MIKYFKRKINSLDKHTNEVVRKSFSSMIVVIAGMVATLGVSLYLGRSLGVEGLGVITLANRIIGLLLVLALFGLPQVVLKHVAIGFERKDWKQVGDSIFTASIISGLLAFIISTTGYFFAPYLSVNIFNEPLLEIPLKISFIVLLPQCFSRIFGAGLNGFRKIWQSNLVNETLSMWIIAVLLIIIHLVKIDINVVNVAIIYAIARILVIITIVIYWKKIFNFKNKRKFIFKPMLKMAMPLMLVSSTAVIATNADSLMLGWLGNITQVGLYNVGSKIAILTSFFVIISNSAVAPKIAALYEKGKIKELEKMIQKVTRVLGIIALFPLPIFLLFGDQILSFWGKGFSEAYWILIILSVGQIFNLATGATGQVLIMCGKEKILGRIKLIEIGSNILLNYILIIHFQAIGAAIATSITLIILNVIKVVYVKKELGISVISKNIKII